MFVWVLRFGILLLGGLPFFAPADAQAVLFPDIATGMAGNPTFKGCPGIGLGAAQPEPPRCAQKRQPEDYCSLFNQPATLANDADAARAAQACLAYFRAALDAQQLSCDYEKDAAELKAVLTARAQGVASAVGAFAAGTSELHCAGELYGYYDLAARRQTGVLQDAWMPSKKLLLHLADIGNDRLKAEVNCQKDGVPSAAPGYLLVGASTHSLSDQQQTWANLSLSLSAFSSGMHAQFLAAASGADQIAQGKTDLSGISPTAGIAAAASRRADVKRENLPEGEKEDYATTGTTHFARNASQQAALAALSGEEGKIRALLVPTASATAWVTPAAVSQVMGKWVLIGLGVTYLEKGKVTAQDALGAIFTTGVGVVSMALGAPVLATSGASVAASLIVDKLKNNYNAYDIAVLKAYVAFSQQIVKQAANATSQQIAQAYRPRKSKLAYCSQCSQRDLRFDCPGMKGFAHGYNPDYLRSDAPEAGQAFDNPWLNAAYLKYRQSYPNGTTLPFIGTGPVSPTSVAP